MFLNCISLVSININRFINNRVTNMNEMFKNCKSLKSLNLTNFFTSKVNSMNNMFQDCISLISLDISNFNTQSVTSMKNMFYNCVSLISLNLSKFNTNNVKYTDNMFNGCESLKYLLFPNFSTKKNLNMGNMFKNCKNLIYVNLENYTPRTQDLFYYFQDSPKYIVVCTFDNYLKNITEENECSTVSCSSNWLDYRKKITLDGNCTDDCTMTYYKYEYQFNCYESCLNGTYNNNYICEDCHPDCKECTNYTNCKECSSPDKYLYFGKCIDECPRESYINKTNQQKTCKCELEQCYTCSIDSFNQNLCTSCETENGYYPSYNDSFNPYYPYYNCSISPEGYYFDANDSVYKMCYLSCETCNESGNYTNHNCLECKKDYNFELHFDFYKNCYDDCSFYHYYDKIQNISFCTNDFECPKDYNKLIIDKKECVSFCYDDNVYKYEFRNKCYEECPPNSTQRINSTDLEGFFLNNEFFCKPICDRDNPYELVLTQECVEYCSIENIFDKLCVLNIQKNDENDNKNLYDIILKNTELDFTSVNFNSSNLEEGNNNIIEFEDMTITLTTTQNQKKDKNKVNVSTVDLLECETLLRETYNISEKEKIFMKKIDVFQDGMDIQKIEYEVYSKLNGTNLIKLNLSICENTKIDISIPVILTDNIDIHNSSSGYYNDICYTSTSENGTDITLKDRRQEFIYNNKTVCQENCVFSDYDYNTQKAKCSCDIVKSSSINDYISINISELYHNFINVKNFANFNLLICYKILFSKKGILNNYGFYISTSIIFLHFISIITFYKMDLYKKIRKTIKNIEYGILNNKSIESEETECKTKENLFKNIGRNQKFKKKINKNYLPNYNKAYNEINIMEMENNQNNINQNPPNKKFRKSKINLTTKNQEDKISEGNMSLKNISKEKNEILKKVKLIMLYNDSELNDMEYKLALKYDKRKYCEYYFSLIKTSHALIFTFFNNTDYNLKIIKINLFLFSFILDIAINALFFDDNTIHEIYVDNGAFNFIYQLPQIIYSTLISYVISIPLKKLALSEDLMIEFKQTKVTKNLKSKTKSLNKKLKRKFVFFFLISSVIYILFWSYISIFCAIYVNTQNHLIKDTVISFGLSLIYPFGIYLIPGIFRIPSLSAPDRSNLYTISKIIQTIFS